MISSSRKQGSQRNQRNQFSRRKRERSKEVFAQPPKRSKKNRNNESRKRKIELKGANISKRSKKNDSKNGSRKRSRKDMEFSDDEDDPNQKDLSIKKLSVDSRNHGRNNNYNEIPSHPFRTLFIGSTGSGKTHVMVNLLTRNRFLRDFFDEMYLFSPQINVEPEFKLIDKMNKRTHIYKFETFPLDNVTRLFRKIMDRGKSIEQEHGNRGQFPRVLIFIDDFASDNRVMNSAILRDIFFTSRKYSISTWISSQYWNRTPPPIRTNAETYLVFEQSMKRTKLMAEEMAVGRYNEMFLMDVMANRVAKERFSFLFINRKKAPKDGRFSFKFGSHLIIQGEEDSEEEPSEETSSSSSEEDSDDQQEPALKKARQ